MVGDMAVVEARGKLRGDDEDGLVFPARGSIRIHTDLHRESLVVEIENRLYAATTEYMVAIIANLTPLPIGQDLQFIELDEESSKVLVGWLEEEGAEVSAASVREVIVQETHRFIADPPSIVLPATPERLAMGATISQNRLTFIPEGMRVSFKESDLSMKGDPTLPSHFDVHALATLLADGGLTAPLQPISFPIRASIVPNPTLREELTLKLHDLFLARLEARGILPGTRGILGEKFKNRIINVLQYGLELSPDSVATIMSMRSQLAPKIVHVDGQYRLKGDFAGKSAHSYDLNDSRLIEIDGHRGRYTVSGFLEGESVVILQLGEANESRYAIVIPLPAHCDVPTEVARAVWSTTLREDSADHRLPYIPVRLTKSIQAAS